MYDDAEKYKLLAEAYLEKLRYLHTTAIQLEMLKSLKSDQLKLSFVRLLADPERFPEVYA